MMTRDKVRGMIVGGAIGDALGMPVETWTPAKIREVHENGIHRYEHPVGHKWFTDNPDDPDLTKTYMTRGMTTDDTQLTVATLKGLNEAKQFSLDEQAKQHVLAYKEGTAGWGKSTIEAIRRLGNGVSWSESGKTHEKGRGTGNGIPMKCSPLGAYIGTVTGCSESNVWNKVVQYSAMTHYTKLAAVSGVVHTRAAWYCLVTDPDDFTTCDFLDAVCNQTFDLFESGVANVEHLGCCADNLEHRMIYLWDNKSEIVLWTPDNIAQAFGGGSCYVYDSLPFSYAFFIQNPHLPDTAIRCINAGGDTDTNGKIVMELIGAIHGYSYFTHPASRWMVRGLKDHDQLLKLADDFCEVFGVAN